MNATAGTSHHFVSRAPGQPSWTPPPIVPIAVQSAANPASLSDPMEFTQAQKSSAPQSTTYTLTTPSQQSLSFEPPSQLSSQYLPRSQHQTPGMFHQAHDFTATGTFVDVTYNNTASNQFMEKLLEKTIPGAEFDSSARDPPPRCHPGTRLAILGRCLDFIRNCNGVKKMRWVVGAAGVGKSAIMQNVAESPALPVNCHASVFFSINGRNDGTKTIITISYQFAAKCDLYRQLVEREITRDPSLLRSSMGKQFTKLIVEPFIHNPELNSCGRFLIIIDGLDECDNPHTQLELLRLISDFCITHPSSPLIWLIASRPEIHITSFFSKHSVIPAYEKEEILVDSDEARADVERFLRDKLAEIKEASDSLDPKWPEERDFWKLADASGGLFAYADTAMRYISDSRIGSPVSQLSDVINVIDEHPMTDVSREEHPMALLDALYDRILLNVPRKIMINTRKLLLTLPLVWELALLYSIHRVNFIVLCNWLGMTRDEAYAAVNHLRSVMNVPRRDKAHEDVLRPFHKSFADYIFDFTRSGFSPGFKDEARQLATQCALRVLKEAHNGIDFNAFNYEPWWGDMLCGLAAGDKTPLTWLVEEAGDWNDDKTRFSLHKLALTEVELGIERGDPVLQNESCIRLLTAQLYWDFCILPHRRLRDFVFDEPRRTEFMMNGLLTKIPLWAIDTSQSLYDVKLQFRRPATTGTNSPDPWNSSCEHTRKGEWEEGRDQDWTTTFWGSDCPFCFEQLEYQVDKWKMQFPNHTALVLFYSSGGSCVEIRFVDSEDAVSEWTYWFWLEFPGEVFQIYGNIV